MDTLLGDMIRSAQNSGCSMFFVTSSLVSLYNGRENRRNSWENAIQDEAFQRELQGQKERYEDLKEAEERTFRLWIRRKQREFIRGEAARKLGINPGTLKSRLFNAKRKLHDKLAYLEL